MNRKQIEAAAAFTSRVDRQNRLSNGEPLNGSIAWEQLDWGGNSLILSGSNVEGLAWYERPLHVIAEIGPRGGVKIRSINGISIH